MAGFYIHADSGFSAEARNVFEITRDVYSHMDQSVSLFGERGDALSQIAALLEEYSNADWDGEGALPLSPAAADRAADLVRALPAGIPLPECAPLPDGCVSLDWIESRNRMVTVSVDGGPRLAYAWLDGVNHGHAVATFWWPNVPRDMLDTIGRVCG